jgi:hypothetical protein
MKTLFPDFPLPEPRPKTGATPGTIGRGPAGETCGSCQHLCRIRYHDKTYFKCGLMRHAWTHGPGTDIRRKWSACELWEQSK